MKSRPSECRRIILKLASRQTVLNLTIFPSKIGPQWLIQSTDSKRIVNIILYLAENPLKWKSRVFSNVTEDSLDEFELFDQLVSVIFY